MSKKAVLVTFHDGTTQEVPRGTIVGDAIKKDKNDDIVACYVNHVLHSLTFELNLSSCQLSPVKAASIEGRSVYAETISFVCQMAIDKVCQCPTAVLIVEYQLGNGYYCNIRQCNCKVDDQFAQSLTKQMKEICDADHVIVQDVLSHQEAIQYFEKNNRVYSKHLCESRNHPEVHVNTCHGEFSLYQHPLFQSTGVIGHDFEVVAHAGGLWIKFSQKYNYDKIDYFTKSLIPVYENISQWGDKLNMNCVGNLNKTVYGSKKKLKNFVALCEAKHDQKINEIATQFMEKKKNKNNPLRLLLIAGPSSSNKTTFARKLCIQLRTRGIDPVVVSVDDYYKPRTECPMDEFGNRNYETTLALRVDVLNRDLQDLMAGKEVEMPVFNFKTGLPEYNGVKTSVGKESVIVMEGILCMDDELTRSVDKDHKFKVFVAPFSQMNIDEKTCVPNSTNRLLRRIYRDYRTRGYSPRQTLAQWPTVRKSEHIILFPLMDSADAIFNSSLEYELPVLKVYLTPLLMSIPPNDIYYSQARDLLHFLESFHSMDESMIPTESLLREFIGNSFYDDL